MQDGSADFARTRALERQPARRHLVQHRTEGKQVGAGVEWLCLHLFRRHIRNRAQHRARTGQLVGRDLRFRVPTRQGSLSRNLGQSEIKNLRVPALGDENIRRLDIAVHDPLRMSGIESVGNFDGQRENQFRFQRTPADAVLQRHAVEILHGDEGPAFALVNFVYDADVGVIQCGCGLRFTLKTGQSLGITGNLFGQELEGYKTMQACVFGLVNHTHSAAAEFFDDPIVGDGLADHAQNLTWGKLASQ